MADPMTSRFEADLAAALNGYADAAPVAVDASVVTRAAAASHPPRPWSGLAISWRAARPALLLAALLALLIAMLLAAGAFPQPSPTRAVQTRLLVADRITDWVVGPDRTVAARGHPNLPRSNGCWLIGGTDTVMSNNHATWAFASLSGEPLPQVTASANYGGGERWSPDRLKVALVAVSDGRVTVLDFTDPSAVTTTPWEVPGLIGAGWLPGSDGMVVVRRVVPGAAEVEVQVRRLDGTADAPQRVDIGAPTAGDETYMIEPIVSPDGRSVVLTGVPSEAAVLADTPLPVLADGGSMRILGPTAYPSQGWSPSSDRLVTLTDGGLAVADEAQARQLELPDGAAGPVAWLSVDRLLVPGPDRAWLVDPVALEVVGSIEDPGSTGLWAVAGDRIVRAALADGAMRVRWYRADGTPDGPDLPLADPERTAVNEPTCLDVQPLPD